MQTRNDLERYRRLFETAQDGILILDAKTGKIEDANPSLVALLGYQREELLGQPFWQVAAFTEIAASPEAFAVLRDGQGARYQSRPLRTKAGLLIQVELTSNTYMDGKKQAMQCHVRDVTEHKRLEDMLREREEHYRLLVEQANDGVFVCDQTGQYIEANASGCAMLGYTREEILQKKVMDLIPAEDRIKKPPRLAELMAGQTIMSERRLIRKDGSLIDVEISSKMLPDGSLHATLRDITQRAQIEMTHAKLAAIVDASDDAIIGGGLNGTITSWNIGAERLYGYTAQETIGRSPAFLLPSDRVDEQAYIHEQIFKGESIKNFETVRVCKDGSTVEVSLTVSPIKDTQGRFAGVATISRDISRSKQAEKKLQESQQLFYGIFHASPAAIVLSRLSDGRFVEANANFAKLTGYNFEEVIGRTSSEAGIMVDPKIREERLNALQENRQLPNFEVEIKRKSGEYRTGLTTVGVIALNSEEYAISTFIDVTERKRAEADLHNGRQFLQSVQDALSAHIAILNHEGIIVQVNAAWRNFADHNGLISPDFGIGANYLKICDVAAGEDMEEAALVAAGIRDVLQGRLDETWVEYPCHSPSQQRWFVARITSFENDGQKWIVISHENITERKLGEEKIQRQLEHLTALSAIDRAIASCFDLKLNLSEILMYVTSELGVDAADIFILNSYMMLEFGAENGFRTKAVKKAHMPLTNHFAGRAIMEGKLIRVVDLQKQDVPLAPEPHWKGEDFACYYALPLIVKGQAKGVLEVFHRQVLSPDREWIDFLHILANQTAIAIENATLFSSLQRSNAELVMAYDATIEGWSRALDLRDRETEGHSLRVTEMSVKLARVLGMTDEQLAQIRWGALLHDIGKMGIPDEILLKAGPLTEEEQVVMRTHPTLAYEMLYPILYLRHALDIPYCHHEKWDGSGYPRGLKGAQIPLSARIFAVIDVWDALKADRPYRSRWTDEQVREHIRFLSGTHFDPQVVDAFLKVF